MSVFTYLWSVENLLQEKQPEAEHELKRIDDARLLGMSRDYWVKSFVEKYSLSVVERDNTREIQALPHDSGHVVRIIYPLVPHESNAIALQMRGPIQQSPHGIYAEILSHSQYDRTYGDLTMHTSQSGEAVEKILAQADEMIAGVNRAAARFNQLFVPWLTSLVHRYIIEAEDRRTRRAQFDVEMRELGISVVSGAAQPMQIQETTTVTLLREYADARPGRIEYTVAPEIVTAIADLMERAAHSFEGAPQAYLQLGEEHLRMIVVGYLNNSFQRTAATGETHSGDGRADILINPREGEILVVEVKEWAGEQGYITDFEQLWERYIPWSSSVGYMLTYTPHANLSTVIAKARKVVEAHPTTRGIAREGSKRHFVTTNIHPRDNDKEMEIHHMFFSLYSPRPTRRGRRKVSTAPRQAGSESPQL